jgi:23S rRNA C2498 (ribose-2'-O)-methylase RlmM
MAAQILVPLKKHDRIEEIVPYIEKVTEPGASVVFLVHHPVNGFKWLQAYCRIAQCGLEKTLTMRRMMESLFSRDARATGSTPGVSNL